MGPAAGRFAANPHPWPFSPGESPLSLEERGGGEGMPAPARRFASGAGPPPQSRSPWHVPIATRRPAMLPVLSTNTGAPASRYQ